VRTWRPFYQRHQCNLLPEPIFPSYPSRIWLFTLPKSAIRSPVQVYHSLLTVSIQLPDISPSRHPLSHVLHCANTPGHIHRTLYVLRASPRVCSRRRLRDTFLAYPPPQWIIPVYSCRSCPTHVAQPYPYLSQLSVISSCIIINGLLYHNSRSMPVT
jgi:hypothetical protein